MEFKAQPICKISNLQDYAALYLYSGSCYSKNCYSGSCYSGTILRAVAKTASLAGRGITPVIELT